MARMKAELSARARLSDYLTVGYLALSCTDGEGSGRYASTTPNASPKPSRIILKNSPPSPAMADDKEVALRELKTIPGVGKSIAADLWSLGIRRVADLKGRDPQALYDELRVNAGGNLDRCMLYVLRCAVYYAGNAVHDPEKLKWWNWKDRG